MNFKYCRLVYKGDLCGYVGKLPSCDKTKPDCRRHGDDEVANGRKRLHPQRFDVLVPPKAYPS